MDPFLAALVAVGYMVTFIVIFGVVPGLRGKH
jgi:hypothetical protein